MKAPTKQAKDALDAVYKAWIKPFTTKSNYARNHADAVADASLGGWITTRTNERTPSNRWRVTPHGLTILFKARFK